MRRSAYSACNRPDRETVMANARSSFDTLANDLQQHEATQVMLYGRHCLCIDGEPFLMLHKEGVAFRLSGRDLAAATSIEGASVFDPLTPEQPSPARAGWVRLPAEQFSRWNEFAHAALHWVRLAQTRNVSWQVPPPASGGVEELPPSTPDGLAKRASAMLKGGFPFTLAKHDD
jgi:hypothetical protein